MTSKGIFFCSIQSSNVGIKFFIFLYYSLDVKNISCVIPNIDNSLPFVTIMARVLQTLSFQRSNFISLFFQLQKSNNFCSLFLFSSVALGLACSSFPGLQGGSLGCTDSKPFSCSTISTEYPKVLSIYSFCYINYILYSSFI